MRHALLGHDVPAAVTLMAAHRHALMDAEEWQLHERTFRMFPAETVAEWPDLLLMAAWRARLGGFDATRVLGLVDRAEGLAAQLQDQSDHALHLQGEIDTFRAIVAYEAAGDPEDVIALARRALATTPRAWYYVRSSAWLYMAVAYQMSRRLDKADADGIRGPARRRGTARGCPGTCGGLTLLHSVDGGRLVAMAGAATHVLAVGEKHHRQESLSWGHYLLGSIAYQQNDLVAAEAHVRVAEEMRYLGRPMAYLQSAFIYASIYQARGLPDLAQQKLDFAFDFLNETGSDGLVPLAEAFRAELAVLRSDPAAASEWATTERTLCAVTALLVLLRAATDAAEVPPGTGYAREP